MSTSDNNIIHAPPSSPEDAPKNGDEESLVDFSLDTHIPGKYKSTISNILSKHCSEVKNNSEEITQSIASISKNYASLCKNIIMKYLDLWRNLIRCHKL